MMKRLSMCLSPAITPLQTRSPACYNLLPFVLPVRDVYRTSLLPTFKRLPIVFFQKLRNVASEHSSHSVGLEYANVHKPVSSNTHPLPSFFAGEDVEWTSLGLDTTIAASLRHAGLSAPSSVQAAAIPPILSSADVIIAAQTGSGKTHAYLAPLTQLLLAYRRGQAEMEVSGGGLDEWDGTGRERRHSLSPKKFILVLCPNATLCQQVASMARKMVDVTHLETESHSIPPTPLLHVYALSGGEPWPKSSPDIVVATAAALLNNLFAFDPRRRRRSAFVRDASWLVVDEADMMLGGGFARDVGRLLGMMRMQEREQAKEQREEEEEGGEDGEEGQKGGEGEIQQPWTYFKAEETAGEQVCDNGDGQEIDEEEEMKEDLGWADEAWNKGPGGVEGEQKHGKESEGRNGRVISGSNSSSSSCSSSERVREWRRVKRLYVRSKQYVFVAATLPGDGRKSVREMLRQQFPEAVWLTGDSLHACNNTILEQQWMEVNVENRVQVLLDAVTHASMGSHGSESKEEAGVKHKLRILVFANSTQAVDAIGRVLARNGVSKCHIFHRDIPAMDRTSSLHSMQEEGGVMVCTDAAARGIDIPFVSHVIQAEFALSAVDFLHRVGRTARAGQSGVVINLYSESDRELVEAVRGAAEAGLPVEGAFSRKRSFRKKFKKYGPTRKGVPNKREI